MPRVLGDNFIHISKLDYIVPEDTDLIELQPPKIGEVQKKIGENIASLVKDGDCLQLGIGAIPDAVLMFLKDKNKNIEKVLTFLKENGAGCDCEVIFNVEEKFEE